jgi:hypothetical protein
LVNAAATVDEIPLPAAGRHARQQAAAVSEQIIHAPIMTRKRKRIEPDDSHLADNHRPADPAATVRAAVQSAHAAGRSDYQTATAAAVPQSQVWRFRQGKGPSPRADVLQRLAATVGLQILIVPDRAAR